jgi:hypothetical protein
MTDFVDERSYLESFIDLLSGSSASKYQGAHETINKIMANADAKTELAKMFELEKGGYKIGYYRHLNPADSTVSIVSGLVDMIRQHPQYSEEEIMRMNAMDSLNNPVSHKDAARALVEVRNQLAK